MSSSGPKMRDLFAAAREDAPSELVRARVWARVAGSAPLSPGPGAVKAVSAVSSTKLVALGVVLGVGVTGLAVTPQTGGALSPPPHREPAVIARGASIGATLADPAPRGRDVPGAPEARPRLAASTDPTRAEGAPLRVVGARAPNSASALAEEARLVLEARAALMRDEPERALALAQQARRRSARALEPEELAVEARALRALGRTEEALATELALRRRFPDNALSR